MNPRALLPEYLEYLAGRGLSKKTVRRIGYSLGKFLAFLDETDLRDVTEETIREYRSFLETTDSPATGKPVSKGTISSELSGLKSFFEYLYLQERILKNPLDGLAIKQPGASQIRPVFSEADIALFLDSIEPTAAVRIRDRALFELMYSSGLRISEAFNLETEQVNFDERVLLVKNGKGGKDRYVPFSKTALQFLLYYVNTGRQERLKAVKQKRITDYLFVGSGGRLNYRNIRSRFVRYLSGCGLDGKGYTMHSIRHATGTHLLNHGAGIRYVQELLGHENLKTTQLYTRPETDKIKAIYRTYHPRENEYSLDLDEEYKEQARALRDRLAWGRRRSRQYKRTGNVNGVGRYATKKKEKDL